MQLNQDNQETLYRAIANVLIEHSDELTDLDQAIGDGDHGINMKRGFEAVLAELNDICALPPDQALKKMGMTLVMKVGGASGPLYGTLFMDLAKACADHESLSFDELGGALVQACEGVKKRGKSDVGAKTMLDVLVPVAQAMADGADVKTIDALAQSSANATVPMQASRGRASFLKERSVGHMDPGARSSQLIINQICHFFGDESESA